MDVFLFVTESISKAITIHNILWLWPTSELLVAISFPNTAVVISSENSRRLPNYRWVEIAGVAGEKDVSL